MRITQNHLSGEYPKICPIIKNKGTIVMVNPKYEKRNLFFVSVVSNSSSREPNLPKKNQDGNNNKELALSPTA